jgi:hypothetical protein
MFCNKINFNHKLNILDDIFFKKYWYIDKFYDTVFQILRLLYIGSTRVNLSNLRSKSWDCDNLIENKSK